MEHPPPERVDFGDHWDGRAEAIAYDLEYCSIAETVFKLGGTEDDLAEALGIEAARIRDWVRENREFAEACETGRRDSESGIQRSLFRAAVGYDHDVEVPLFDGSRSFVETCREHVKPDFAACRSWLINRRPDKWKKVGDGERTIEDFFRSLQEQLVEQQHQEHARNERRNRNDKIIF